MLNAILLLWLILTAALAFAGRTPWAPIHAAAGLSHFALSMLGAIVGLPVVGYLAYRSLWTLAPGADGRPTYQWKPAWAWTWGNREDGVMPPDVVNGKPYLPMHGDRWRAFVWSALRNKASNLRFTRVLSVMINPARVRSVSNNPNLYEAIPAGASRLQWSYAWQGPYFGLWIHVRDLGQFRFGWTIVPADANGFNQADMRQVWCGFSIQLQGA